VKKCIVHGWIQNIKYVDEVMFGEGKEFIDAVVCRLDAEDMIHKAIEGEGKVGVGAKSFVVSE